MPAMPALGYVLIDRCMYVYGKPRTNVIQQPPSGGIFTSTKNKANGSVHYVTLLNRRLYVESNQDVGRHAHKREGQA